MSDLPTEQMLMLDGCLCGRGCKTDYLRRVLAEITVDDLMRLLGQQGCEINFEGFALLGGISGVEYTVVIPKDTCDD